MKTVMTIRCVGSYAELDDFLAGEVSSVLTLEFIRTDIFMLPMFFYVKSFVGQKQSALFG
jgi:hypothetical protein